MKALALWDIFDFPLSWFFQSALLQPLMLQETAKGGMTGLQSCNIMGKEQT